MMAGNVTFLSVCSGESQAGNPIGSALVLTNCSSGRRSWKRLTLPCMFKEFLRISCLFLLGENILNGLNLKYQGKYGLQIYTWAVDHFRLSLPLLPPGMLFTHQ